MRRRFSFAASWQFLKSSWNFLTTNKDLLVLPAISMVSTVILIGLIAASGFKWIDTNTAVVGTGLYWMLGWMVCAFLLFVNTIFFNVALVSCISQRMIGNKGSVQNGITFALNHLKQIIGWAIISAIVSTILNTLENSHSLVRSILALILNFAWSISALFVIPILVNENVGPITALKQSINTFGKHWRCAVKVNFILGLMLFAIVLVVLMLSTVIAITPGMIFAGGIAALILFAIYITVANALNAVVNTAIYLNFDKNIVPPGFTNTQLGNALVERKKRFSK